MALLKLRLVSLCEMGISNLFISLLQEEHEYHVRVFARNEVGTSDPLETEDPVKVIRPAGKYRKIVLGHIFLSGHHLSISVSIQPPYLLTFISLLLLSLTKNLFVISTSIYNSLILSFFTLYSCNSCDTI